MSLLQRLPLREWLDRRHPVRDVGNVFRDEAAHLDGFRLLAEVDGLPFVEESTPTVPSDGGSIESPMGRAFALSVVDDPEAVDPFEVVGVAGYQGEIVDPGRRGDLYVGEFDPLSGFQ